MKKRTTAIAAALSILVCGSPLLTGCSSFRGNSAFQNALEKQNESYAGAILDYTKYTKAIEIDPNNANAYVNRGIANRNLDNYSEAISDFSKAMEIDPKYVDAYVNRGIAKRTLGDSDGAIYDFNKVINIDPNNANAYVNRGLAKYYLGDNAGAISDYKKGIEINPRNAPAYYN